jgi:hypothetical protein
MTGCGTPPGNRSAAPNARPNVDVTRTALQLAADRSRWEGLVRFDAISRCRISLDVGVQYEAWLLTWLPGQHTVWHDHGGSDGAFVVLQGILTEQRAAVRLDSPPSAEPFAQQYAYESVRAFDGRHIHMLRNAAPRPAVSLHLYMPPNSGRLLPPPRRPIS